ncbi:MAG TPA: hypothetical protein VJM33_05975 [Microthrixaceae bacterium]|nr:hypothetical protein [Microthrixaceae bacterium]
MRRSWLLLVVPAVALAASCIPPPEPPPTTTTSTSVATTTTTVVTSNEATAVSAGGGHACAVLSDGGVSCWGWNAFGQLGSTTNSGSGFGNTTPNPVPDRVDGIDGVIAVTAGEFHTCALLDDGTVWCWGVNAYGQLGTETNLATLAVNPTPIQVLGIGPATAVAAGENHTCALVEDDGVWCWGLNLYRQLGHETNAVTFNPNPIPTQVGGTLDAVSLSLGSGHSCIVTNTSEMKCWGLNRDGQLGNPAGLGTFVTSSTPLAVTGMTHAAVSEGGGFRHCAVLSDATVSCWGHGYFGDSPDAVPDPVDGLADVVSLSGGLLHTCGVVSAGKVLCLGVNGFGELGNTGPGTFTPTIVGGIDDAVTVSAGTQFTCALHAGGAISCWGHNSLGQLGNLTNVGTETPNPSPLPVIGFP